MEINDKYDISLKLLRECRRIFKKLGKDSATELSDIWKVSIAIDSILEKEGMNKEE